MSYDTRNQLPTKEEIFSVTNPDELRAWEEEFELVAEKIRTDLEFIDGDELWQSRARMALAAYKITLSNIRKQLRRLAGNKHDERQIAQQEVKITKQQLKLANKEKAIEQVRAAKEKAAVTLANRKLNLLQSLSLSNAFMTYARNALPPELFQQIWDAASKRVYEVNKKEIEDAGREINAGN